MHHAHRPLRAVALLLTIAAGCSKPVVSLTGYDGGDDDPEFDTDNISTAFVVDAVSCRRR